MVDTIGWQWIFFINIPFGILACYLIARIMVPDTKREKAAGRFDIAGLILSMTGILLVVYAFTLVGQTQPGTVTPLNPRGDIYGWGYWLVWTLVGTGVALLALFAFFELKVAKEPVLDLRLFRQKNFTLSAILVWTLNMVVFGSIFLIPVFLQQFKGQSAVATGLFMLPMGLASGIAIISGSRLYDIIGPRSLVIMGLVVMSLSSILLYNIPMNADGWTFVPILFLRGLGFGWSFIPLQTLALSVITGKALPRATSLFNATAQVFSSIGTAVLSTFFVQQLATHGREVGARLIKGPPTPEVINQVKLEAGVTSFTDVFLPVSIATGVVILIALLLPNRSLKQQQDAAGGEASETEPVMVMGG